MGDNRGTPSIGRREFIRKGAAAGVGVAAAPGLSLRAAAPEAQSGVRWDRTADVVIVGAGGAGLPAAIAARDQGASVIVLDENHDVGGHAIISGGWIPLGGGTPLQKKYGIEDSADQVYLDHTNHLFPHGRYCDRELVRVWADENLPTVEFLLENGVRFKDERPTIEDGTVPRRVGTALFSDDLRETINGRAGSGLVRPLERSARAKGAEFLLRHKMTRLIREPETSGRVLGVSASVDGRDVNVRGTRGVILATGGHSSNVAFRRMFDPRLTEEYQTAGEPWSSQNADGELQAMAIGAALWATSNAACENGRAVTKTQHIGCQWGYVNLKWKPESPVFPRARASGLTVTDFQDVILVNQAGSRFWNEDEDTIAFVNACLGTNGNLGRNGKKVNGGGPIWAIFDSDALTRENWDPTPPHVDPDGWFFSADTLAGLAASIVNPYQVWPMPGGVLENTVAKYNSYVDLGTDPEFGKPGPRYKIRTPPFYAAWSTPIVHDSQTGLRVDPRCRVLDLDGQVIAGLYAAGEVAGGFALHGLPRVVVFGRLAGREAARAAVGP